MRASIKANAKTQSNVLSDCVLGMKVTDIEAENSVLKVWIEEGAK